MIHIVAFFRRLLGLRKPAKAGRGIASEKQQEIPEEKETEPEREAPSPEKGKAQQRKKRKPSRKGKTKKGRTR